MPVIVPPNAIVSEAASPKVIVPPLNVDVPVTVAVTVPDTVSVVPSTARL